MLRIYRFLCFDDPVVAVYEARTQARVYELAREAGDVEISFRQDDPPGCTPQEYEYSVMYLNASLDRLSCILAALRWEGFDTRGLIHTDSLLGYEGELWSEPDVLDPGPRRSYCIGREDLADVAAELAAFEDEAMKERAEREFDATPDCLVSFYRD